MPLTTAFSVAQLLKAETLHAHERAEELLTPKLFSISSYEDYASVLKMFYGYFSPAEALAKKYVTRDILSDIDERRSSLFILQDLKAINYSTASLPLCHNLPKITSSLEALGIMYVLEGSTLGGRMISKMLAKNSSAVFNDSNLNFFNGYKENTGTKWTYFLSVINQYDDDADVMVAAANETFNCMTKWMEETL